jgi:chromosome segregation ATPase
VTESFGKLKTRYDTLKDSASSADDREERLVAQNRELKQSMVDLTAWSNNLKANTEKKLAASFETASRFRTMYLDKETREAKVADELKVARCELESRDQTMSEALAKVFKLEANLNKADDARRSSDRNLSQIREELSRAESQRADLLAQISTLEAKLTEAAVIEMKFEAAEAASKEANARLTDVEKENKELKARAYDELTKIRKLETQLKDKKIEIEEMTQMCEELMAREEARRIGK